LSAARSPTITRAGPMISPISINRAFLDGSRRHSASALCRRVRRGIAIDRTRAARTSPHLAHAHRLSDKVDIPITGTQHPPLASLL
jgi:hypothetical protein